MSLLPSFTVWTSSTPDFYRRRDGLVLTMDKNPYLKSLSFPVLMLNRKTLPSYLQEKEVNRPRLLDVNHNRSPSSYIPTSRNDVDHRTHHRWSTSTDGRPGPTTTDGTSVRNLRVLTMTVVATSDFLVVLSFDNSLTRGTFTWGVLLT